ncbi:MULTISPECIES: acetylornithine deacetylase [Kordiimonas]|uniref:acetylornithine deacetylase n=1 Tax=Kordiimonas TaxID=288021 RepID=UPI002579E9E8|nr:acetylornithine deacetylase [Kordiimonas sp. UBA4487]
MASETQNTQAILERLVGYDTTSRLSNLELINYIQSYLQDFDIESKIQFNGEKSKANIVATIGPDVPGGVVLSGHTDVVPVDGQDWATDPFTLTEKGGQLVGRGSADMKGFIASALAAVPQFKAANLKRPIHFAFTYDEEVGCLGIQSLLPVLKDQIAQPRLVVVGEPTSMQVANAHKGQYVSKTRIWGREAHSSRPEDGVNAVAVAAELITFIGSLAAKARIHGPHDDSFDPTYTSFNVGPISGGSAFNIIPNYCEFDWEFRAVPNADPAAILQDYTDFLSDVINPHLEASFPECRAENAVWAYLPPLKAEPGSDAETLALALAGRNDTTVVAFGTEAGHIQSIDFPAVVCGPGDIAQAHKPNEFIDKSQLDACDAFMKRLADVLSA